MLPLIGMPAIPGMSIPMPKRSCRRALVADSLSTGPVALRLRTYAATAQL